MELRPELTPPMLNETLVAQLAKLADRLDGAAEGERNDELAEFNRLAGTAIPLQEFQGIYRAVNPEDFVRDVLHRRSLKPIPDLSRAEMVEIVSRLQTQAGKSEESYYFNLFQMHCKHPGGSNLIYYPEMVSELPQDREPTAEEIADCAELAAANRGYAGRKAQRWNPSPLLRIQPGGPENARHPGGNRH